LSSPDCTEWQLAFPLLPCPATATLQPALLALCCPRPFKDIPLSQANGLHLSGESLGYPWLAHPRQRTDLPSPHPPYPPSPYPRPPPTTPHPLQLIANARPHLHLAFVLSSLPFSPSCLDHPSSFHSTDTRARFTNTLRFHRSPRLPGCRHAPRHPPLHLAALIAFASRPCPAVLGAS
jgi:hypothetical protein